MTREPGGNYPQLLFQRLIGGSEILRNEKCTHNIQFFILSLVVRTKRHNFFILHKLYDICIYMYTEQYTHIN